ncbi:hypothetical protein QRD89_08265 [Halobacillus sp. ACCC02827]|uniref:hypothetical protein n=1 Tax=Bacillaceae TaxID=186817 RepID=UPI0002A4F521|nr:MULTISPECIES: hypothetical protein [Bacillaceae]ELK45001.1 hypothetical protein D479_16579 [Halobacillus sp. BAB-2008]WJE17328.1 hypothetical protein QRD89_08265 [Halobacillus sp. ACCC02827]
MKHVMEALRKREAEEKLPVIRMEIDYELVSLHDAILAGDQEQMKKTKKRLSELRRQLIEWSI